jgi:glycerophosphoryl diester phosphodiesterase
MLSIDRLISHRFRGFSAEENTIAGLNAALSFGVRHLEFDIRVSKCGTPMIYHDEFARAGDGKIYKLCDIMADDFAPQSEGGIGGRFAIIPTAQALFEAASKHPQKNAKLLVDVKDAGFEESIHALISLYRLKERTVYVSWLPETLYQFHAIAPDIPLCLSHWCKNPNQAIRALHKVHKAKHGHIPRGPNRLIHGHRSGYYVKDGLRGEMRDMLKKTAGSVCVPQDMVSADLVAAYQADGIKVSTFSYVNWPAINAHEAHFGVDLYFIDDKAVFDALED